MRTTRFVELSVNDVLVLIEDYTEILPTDNDGMLCMKSYIRGLDKKHQTILVLWLEGYTSRTIAAFLSISHGTVLNYVRKMKAELSLCGRG